MEFSTPARSPRAVEPPPLSDEQTRAIERIERHLTTRSGRPFIVHGGAGTGKSRLLAAVAARVQCKIAAPTGRAAALLARMTGRPTSTIHRLLYATSAEFSGDIGAQQPTFELCIPPGLWAGRVILLDEVSMIGRRLGHDLIRTGATVIGFGDPAQLPPVLDAPFFNEADIELRTVHRQAADSSILRQAMRVRDGGSYRSDTPDFRIVRAPSDDDLRSADVVLCFSNHTRRRLNARIRWLKGFGPGNPQKGERVIAQRNDYKNRIFNGEIFTLMAPIENDHLPVLAKSDSGQTVTVHATFPGVRRPPDAPAARTWFDFAYAITVHKAQGSEFDSVVIIDEFPDGPDRNRWLYTALTRARKRIVIAGGRRLMAARHQRVHRRPFLPTHAHPADPAAVHQRAAEIGRAAADADGGLGDGAIADLIDVLAQAATTLGYPGDPAGLKTRLAWTVADARAGRARSRRWSERQVRYAAIAAITRGLPHHSVLHAATQANAAAELPMSEADVEILVKVERAIESRRRECECCSPARAGRD